MEEMELSWIVTASHEPAQADISKMMQVVLVSKDTSGLMLMEKGSVELLRHFWLIMEPFKIKIVQLITIV